MKTKQDTALFNSFLRQKGEEDQPEKFTPKELDNFSVARVSCQRIKTTRNGLRTTLFAMYVVFHLYIEIGYQIQ